MKAEKWEEANTPQPMTVDLLRQLADEIDPPEPAKPVQDAMEGAARVLTAFAYEVSELPDDPSLYDDMAQALAESQLLATPRPMTVGQLGAEHVGKRIEVGGDGPRITLTSVEHLRCGEAQLWDVTQEPTWTLAVRPDTPCTVVDE